MPNLQDLILIIQLIDHPKVYLDYDDEDLAPFQELISIIAKILNYSQRLQYFDILYRTNSDDFLKKTIVEPLKNIKLTREFSVESSPEKEKYYFHQKYTSTKLIPANNMAPAPTDSKSQKPKIKLKPT